MSHPHEQDLNPSAPTEEAVVWGYLMAVDWTKKIARLEPRGNKPVKLHFGSELAGEMRRFATLYVKITGRGQFDTLDAENWSSIQVESIDGGRSWAKPFDISELDHAPKIFRAADDVDDLFESDEEFEEYIRVIYEGRHV